MRGEEGAVFIVAQARYYFGSIGFWEYAAPDGSPPAVLGRDTAPTQQQPALRRVSGMVLHIRMNVVCM